ncbi:FHA domain-containing protein [Actinomycetospora termitidis]|uniref:FHA domain-containing protein n=1 Tax=Actinomycetospora termitidis TaxID=3053470 RepID=A0ABT7MI82_9PSEU|nr:FHA domain-containing protein [Actinomycetospora sp. Odt1-22]MDL5159013.1 FHA domain-containing protein [Actinomycetospora sp. Odt1-22]
MARSTRPPAPRRSGVELLPPETHSLARGIPESPEGTLFVLGDRGGIRVDPETRFEVLFGRNEPEVHVCLGADDPGISRRHGLLSWSPQGWSLRNTGVVPIRFPGSRLLLSGHEEPLGSSYTPLFIRTEAKREHLLELRVATRPPRGEKAKVDDPTRRPTTWELSEHERLLLTALGERYLRHEPHPQPNTWKDTYLLLEDLDPDYGWTTKKAEHDVARVRERLTRAGVVGLTRDEVGEPAGNAINHNLLLELLVSTSLVPPDLRLLDR